VSISESSHSSGKPVKKAPGQKKPKPEKTKVGKKRAPQKQNLFKRPKKLQEKLSAPG
jgi:hypothetical protein